MLHFDNDRTIQAFALVGVQPGIGVLADFGQKKPFFGFFCLVY
jgi:hypothetical protein